MKCALFISMALAGIFAQTLQNPDMTATPSCPVCCPGRNKCVRNAAGLFGNAQCCPEYCCSTDTTREAGSFVCCDKPTDATAQTGCLSYTFANGDIQNQCGATSGQVMDWECTTMLSCGACQAKPHCTFFGNQCQFRNQYSTTLANQIDCTGGQVTPTTRAPTNAPPPPPPPTTRAPTASTPVGVPSNKYTGTCYNRCGALGWGILREQCLLVRGDAVQEQCPSDPGKGILYCNCPAYGEKENELKKLCCGSWSYGWINPGWIISNKEAADAATMCSCDAKCTNRLDEHDHHMGGDCCKDKVPHCSEMHMAPVLMG